MKILNHEVNGYQLRCKQGEWYFQLWRHGKDIKLDYGPFTYNDAMDFIDKHEGEFIDMDRELTKAKIKAEANGL